MSKSMLELSKELKKQHKTEKNKHGDFPVGAKAKVITPCQDFHFFYGETGKVIRNNGGYLGIILEFDTPRVFEGGMIQKVFNFNPSDLILITEEIPVESCPHCGKLMP